jgi:hypothetical protein
MEAWLRVIIGLFIAAHGLVYVVAPFTPMAPGISQGWKGSSAVLGTAFSSDNLKSLTVGLWVLAGIGLLAAAATIIFTSLVPGLWRPLAIGASLVGIASFIVFFDGQAQQFVNQGGIGMIISLGIAGAASAFPQAF